MAVCRLELGRLLSLTDLMRYFNAHTFASHVANLSAFSDVAEQYGERPLDEASKTNLLTHLRAISEDCSDVGLPVSIMAANGLIDTLGRGEITSHRELAEPLRDVMKTMARELAVPRFFHISTAKIQYNEPNLFDSKVDSLADAIRSNVSTSFPTASFDIAEAGKCLALGRNTACVFHLMRVVEIGLKALGRELEAPIEGIDSWEDILRKLRDALKLRLFDKRPDPSKQYFDSLIGYLYAIKTAWRNPTMHIGAKYDEEEAAGIFNAVKIFMRTAAEKLNDC